MTDGQFITLTGCLSLLPPLQHTHAILPSPRSVVFQSVALIFHASCSARAKRFRGLLINVPGWRSILEDHPPKTRHDSSKAPSQFVYTVSPLSAASACVVQRASLVCACVVLTLANTTTTPRLCELYHSGNHYLELLVLLRRPVELPLALCLCELMVERKKVFCQQRHSCFLRVWPVHEYFFLLLHRCIGQEGL